MKSVLKASFVAIVNLFVFIALLGATESYFRKSQGQPEQPFAKHNGIWQSFRPYVMFTTAPGEYRGWYNEFTKEFYPANVVTNSLGFNDPREFSLTRRYFKAANEKFVLFTSGSVGWGVGATATDKTVASRIEHYLNTLQNEVTYTVVNLSMGSWIAYQQFLGLQLWGEVFDPDWVVVMDGHNDAGVGCGFSQGIGNPMFFATIKSYIDGYLFSKARPTFYRGWLENELIKHSVAYRTLTGKEPIEDTQAFDETSTETITARRQIIPTKVSESRQMLDFYLKAQRAMLNLFPNAKFILSTQPMVNDFTGEFVDLYQSPSDSEEHRKSMDRREGELEHYLDHYKDGPCRQATSQPSFTYIFVVGAIRLERMVDSARADGRDVEYHNTGTLFPNARAERIPYFIDAAHLSDKGADVLGRFYAQRILANTAKSPEQADFLASPSPRSSTARVSVLSASYGANCGASSGNVTYALRSTCEGRETCDYLVDVNTLGDPATGCAKSFSIDYSCGPFRLQKEIRAEASGRRVQLCSAGIEIRSATYGANCGAQLGNVSAAIAAACRGKAQCDYTIDVNKLGDPAPGCAKDFAVEYYCSPDKPLRKNVVGPEAGLGSEISLCR
jgi:hypothetical protein